MGFFTTTLHGILHYNITWDSSLQHYVGFFTTTLNGILHNNIKLDSSLQHCMGFFTAKSHGILQLQHSSSKGQSLARMVRNRHRTHCRGRQCHRELTTVNNKLFHCAHRVGQQRYNVVNKSKKDRLCEEAQRDNLL